jgi:hypothetical protein
LAVLTVVAAAACAGELSLDIGAHVIGDRETFQLLSSTATLPGGGTVEEVKFIITGIRSGSPDIYFQNTENYNSHYQFYVDALGHVIPLYDFNLMTYFPYDRMIIAGSILSHGTVPSGSAEDAVYTMEFWPVDILGFQDISTAYELVSSGMYCSAEKIMYHPSGQSQIEQYQQDIGLYRQAGIPVIMTDSLYGSFDYIPYNTAESFGILREPGYAASLTFTDIPVLRNIPNTMGHVAGIISMTPQTPLSHVNLLAMQNGIPNAYIASIAGDSSFAALYGSSVRLEVRTDGYTIEEASSEEFNSFYEALRPERQTFPYRDLTVLEIPDLDDVGFRDRNSIGAKSSNLAELAECLPGQAVPHGAAVPFYYYDQFFRANGLYDAIREIMLAPEFRADPQYRRRALDGFRSMIELSPFPEWMLDSLGRITDGFPAGTSLRCRSSTNNEDLQGFSGAGLYRSYTHHPGEGHVATTIRQVWAGLWTYRAFEEREFYRIDHFSTAMGVLIHPSYRNELANGVAVTRNILNPAVPGFYVNVQVGGDMVTNPEELSVPDEFIIITSSPIGEYICEPLYVSFSNRTQDGEPVLDEYHIRQLAEYLRRVHDHFSCCYMAYEDPQFAMEVEFKITADGVLVIKQARPWVTVY